MSFFENERVSESVKFYSLHIDPKRAGVDGMFSIANGHSVIPSKPDQQFDFVVDDSNSLHITSQVSGPSPLIENMSLMSSGNVDVHTNFINNVASPLAPNDAANKTYVDSKISTASTVTLTTLYPDGSTVFHTVGNGNGAANPNAIASAPLVVGKIYTLCGNISLVGTGNTTSNQVYIYHNQSTNGANNSQHNVFTIAEKDLTGQTLGFSHTFVAISNTLYLSVALVPGCLGTFQTYTGGLNLIKLN